MTFTVTADGPLEPGRTLARYHLWGEDPATPVGTNSVCRVLRAADRLHAYEVTWHGGPDHTRLEVAVHGADGDDILSAVRREVSQLFGLDAATSSDRSTACGRRCRHRPSRCWWARSAPSR